MPILKELFADEKGQGIIEYSLILAVIAIAVIVLGEPIKTTIINIWTEKSSEISTVDPG